MNVGDTTSIMGFLTHFLRSEYGTLRLYSGNEQHNVSLLDKIRFYLSSVGAVRLQAVGCWILGLAPYSRSRLSVCRIRCGWDLRLPCMARGFVRGL